MEVQDKRILTYSLMERWSMKCKVRVRVEVEGEQRRHASAPLLLPGAGPFSLYWQERMLIPDQAIRAHKTATFYIVCICLGTLLRNWKKRLQVRKLRKNNSSRSISGGFG
jgi:hypothetical protein